MKIIKHTLSVTITLLLFLVSCSKNKNGCWQAFTPSGGDLPGLVVCDKTKSEAEAEYGYWFYNVNEKKYCWQVQTPSETVYARNIPQSMVDRLKAYGGYTYTKTDCNSFCTWSTIIEKQRSKITGLYGPTRHLVETFMADSCSKLYIGRIIVVRETADSIITREFAEKIP